MTVELSATVEEELRRLAVMQNRDISVLIEEAIRQYLESAAITDLDPADIGEAQARLIGELRGIDHWEDRQA
jgi:predicted transcriptional regulator